MKRAVFNFSVVALMALMALLALLALFAAPRAIAAPGGEGHDHGDAPAATTHSGPQRLPDGSVFLPKPAQRQIGVRTLLAVEKELPRSLELSGKVVMDPNAGGKVQPTLAGRIEPWPAWAAVAGAGGAQGRSAGLCGDHCGQHRALQSGGPSG